jgi:UTP--glucose-1-phosphate uridylyltransferase
MNLRKAVITAAARGSRLFPVADTVQKAMIPMVDTDGINKPIIQIVAEEAIESGIEEICIVCAPGDEQNYLAQFKTLHSTLLETYNQTEWGIQQAQNLRSLMDRLSFAVQAEPLGYGDAVFKARSFVGNEPFLLLLGDYLYVPDQGSRRCARQLIELAVTENCSVSAVNPTHESQIGKYGTLTGKAEVNYQGVYQIERIIEKPSVSLAEVELQTPGLRSGYYLCFFGMHVFKPVIFDMLHQAQAGNSFLPLTPTLQVMAETERYLASEMRGTRYDTSKKYGLLQAQIALGLSGCNRGEILATMVQSLADSGLRT